MTERTLHLNVNIVNAGVSAGSWRYPGTDPRRSYTADHVVEIARIAEEGLFDAIFLPDGPAVGPGIGSRGQNGFEPTVILSRVAALTDRIGLIGTLSSTYDSPDELAVRTRTLDLLSGRRFGWNVVATAGAEAARNFGLPAQLSHEDRYAQATRFVDAVLSRWDEDGEPRPVIVQAGASPAGITLGGRYGEVIFTTSQSRRESEALAGRIRSVARAHDRRNEEIVLLPGLSPIIGSTEREARERADALADLIPLDYALVRMETLLGIPLGDLDPDEPIPHERLLDPASIRGVRSQYEVILDIIRTRSPSLRGLVRELGGGTGHRVLIGTPELIADDIQEWFESGAADGFNLMPDVLPAGLRDFVDHVVPILQARGLFRREYDTTTLRSHLGLAAERRGR